VLAGLKDFQRDTVDYVFQRFYVDKPPARKFLVADEVGLGKTLVARGLIARAIRHLQTLGIERIDVVYVCSNADIARQNVNRLNVTDRQEFNLPTRITLLPLQMHALKSHGINFVSFTPGTTFDLKSRSGVIAERALIYWLLHHAWGWRRERHVGVFEVLRGSAGLESFRSWVQWTPREIGAEQGRIDPGLAEAFKMYLAADEDARHARGELSLQDRFEDLAERNRRASSDWRACFAMVGELRHLLARSCVNALEPDVIILDEFQRFRNLLDGHDAASELAQHLFEQDTAKVLLLSATPYKMFTLSEESHSLDDHYTDFERTTRFLMKEDQIDDSEAELLKHDLQSFRRALLDLESIDLGVLKARRNRVERRLRRVMSRTERLAVTPDRNGMLSERQFDNVRLHLRDLQAYVVFDQVSRRLGTPDSLEYWKSAPYLLNFMESYKLKRSFRDAMKKPALQRELATILSTRDGLLLMSAIESYGRVDPGNARLRALMHDVLDNEAWRLLWLPPSLHYYQPGKPFNDTGLDQFTKRLVFSAWWVVPQVISTLTSYEAERRMVRSRGRRRRKSSELHQGVRPLLRFQRVRGGRVSGMPVFALMYPSPALARLADPLQLVDATGTGALLPDIAQTFNLAKQQIEGALSLIMPPGQAQDGPIDERWYWAAPLLLDAQSDPLENAAWLSRENLAAVWRSDELTAPDEGESSLADVLTTVRDMVLDPASLGRAPDDLAEVLARMALAGPAVCALRALSRTAGGLANIAHTSLRDAAARVAWGFRTLFNTPEVMAMIRGKGNQNAEAYWRVVLDYCLNGELQAVLDEYAHVLREWLGILDPNPAIIGDQVGGTIYDALSLRAATYGVEDVNPRGRDRVDVTPRRLRARYALRFGAENADESGDPQRAGQVRKAFNSPFWPFVLATTSVGQEGLDFHLYCHAVVHWNLPSNPVDFEQREGRVHRYKGHAIRKNVAARNAVAAFTTGSGDDPWEAMFAAARLDASPEAGDLEPYWVYAIDGGATIERYVPALPLSREIEKLELLKRSLAIYRLAFGQPRQDDLTLYLSRLPEDRLRDVMSELRIDLTPPRSRERSRYRNSIPRNGSQIDTPTEVFSIVDSGE
jgi:hypothetical protein